MKYPADDMCHVSQSVADWRFADRVRNGPGAVSLKYNASRARNSTLSRQIYRASAQISVSDMCVQFVGAFPRDKAGIEITELSLLFTYVHSLVPREESRNRAVRLETLRCSSVERIFTRSRTRIKLISV